MSTLNDSYNTGEISIDFEQASKISRNISLLAEDAQKAQSDFLDVASIITNMPSGYKDTTMSVSSEISDSLLKIKKAVENALSAFDQSIKNYHDYEIDSSSTHTVDDINRIASLNRFIWNYPAGNGKLNTVDADTLRDILSKRNAYTSDQVNYTFSCNGQEYTYNVDTHILRYRINDTNFRVYCDFYADSSISGDNIGSFDNTVTILGGSSETKRFEGEATRVVGENTIPLGTTNISSNSLVVIPTFLLDSSGRLEHAINSNPHLVTSCTLAGDYLITGGTNKGVSNSVIGYSIGGQYLTSAIKSNSSLYDKCVFVNSAAYSDAIDSTNAEVGFEVFKNTEVIFIESRNNNNWNTAVKKTINSMQSCGVSSDNIKFYTNDTSLVNFAEKRGIAYDLIDHEKYNGHSCGYKMIGDSNILSYLSSSRK